MEVSFRLNASDFDNLRIEKFAWIGERDRLGRLRRAIHIQSDTFPLPVVMALFLYFHAVVPSRTEFYSSVSHAVGGRATSPRSPTPLFHAMGGSGNAPADSRHFVWMEESYGKNREPQPQKQESSAGSDSSTPGGVICSNCDRVIV